MQEVSLCVFTGMTAGYLAYDCLHYVLHHGGGSSSRWLPLVGQLRRTHLCHHFRDREHSFGISSPLLDVLLGSVSPLLAGRSNQPSACRPGLELKPQRASCELLVSALS